MFQNRKVAALICAVVVILSVLVGGYTSLDRIYNETSRSFYAGENDDGRGIFDSLNKRCNLANNLLTVAIKYMGESEPEVKAVKEAVEEVRASYTPPLSFQANKELTRACDDLYNFMAKYEMEDSDQRYRQRIYTDLQSENMILDNNSFNTMAQQFNKTLESYPAKLIAQITGIRVIELYQ